MWFYAETASSIRLQPFESNILTWNLMIHPSITCKAVASFIVPII